MSIAYKVFNLFRVSSDADATNDASFKATFSNVVNFLMLAESLVLGLCSLAADDSLLATLNLGFCLLFMTYFVLIFVVKKADVFISIDRFIIFLYFLVIFITSSYHKEYGLTLVIYPFIAIILHGSKAGVSLSFLQLILICIYDLFCLYVLDFSKEHIYSLPSLVTIAVYQICLIFVYYVAVRWLKDKIHDKEREFSILKEELRVKDELVKSMANAVEKPLKGITDAASVLASERLNTLQNELVSLIQTSAFNASNNINAVMKAAKKNIPIIPAEEVKFSPHSLLSSIVSLYKCSDDTKKHRYNAGSNLPEKLLGNSILTRQVLLNVLDALESKIGLADYNLKVTASREDVFDKDIIIHFSVFLALDAALDIQHIASRKDKLIDYLELGVTQRIVESEGCELSATVEKDGIHVDFSLKYKDDNQYISNDAELLAAKKITFDRVVLIKDAVILVMTDDDMLWAQIGKTLESYVSVLRRTSSSVDTVKTFSNSMIDLVIVDLNADEGNGLHLVSLIRSAESGIARKVPILCVINPENQEQEDNAVHSGFDAIIRLPFDEDVARATVASFFM